MKRLIRTTSYISLLSAGLLLGATACSDPSFTVEGNISDAAGKTITLEKADHAGIWVALDSVKIGNSGKYSFSHIAPAYPDIYRLRLDGRYVYFPVDSIETITIDAPGARFATDFTIAGSDQAVAMGNFEKELLAAIPRLSVPDSATSFKRRIYTRYLQDANGSVMSYYILTKTVDGEPLFRLPEDAKYFAAVATAFSQYRPDDPRLQMLTATATRSRRAGKSSPSKVMEAAEISYFDIDLPDHSGRQVRLSDMAGKGAATVLLFSDLSDPGTPALNAELRKLQGVKIYNVGLDDDQLAWRNAAANLPWTCVYANDSEASTLASQYQIASLPTMFVIDGAGSLKARCASVAELRRNL